MFGALHDEGNISSSIKTTLSGYERPTEEPDKLPPPSTTSETTASLQQAGYEASHIAQGPQIVYYPQTTSYGLPPLRHSTTTYDNYLPYSTTPNAQPTASQVSSQYSSQHSRSPVIEAHPASLPYSHWWLSTTAQIGSSPYNPNTQHPLRPSHAAFHSLHSNSATAPDAGGPLPPSYRSLSRTYPYSSSENNQASSGSTETVPPHRGSRRSSPSGSVRDHSATSSRASGNTPVSISRCSSCKVTTSPEWRRGPSGKKDLCNSCVFHISRV